MRKFTGQNSSQHFSTTVEYTASTKKSSQGIEDNIRGSRRVCSASCARIEIGISKRDGKAGMLMLPKIIYGNLANLWTESDTPKLTYRAEKN